MRTMKTDHKNFLKLIVNKKMLRTFLMGFSSGLPLLLTLSLLQAWLQNENVDIKDIGLFALVQLPYSWKFLWSPIVDRFNFFFLGRRKSWLIISQVGLIFSIVGLAFSNPPSSLLITSFFALLIAFFSATQDIVIDAYRREDLQDNELGMGSSLYMYGYRIAMLIASGGGLILSDKLSFTSTYLIMASLFVPLLFFSFLVPETKGEKEPETIKKAIIEPFYDYFKKKESIMILLFIFFYKFGDTMASTMTMPFYLEIGFSKTEIGTIVKIFGFWATMGGAAIGGVLMLKLGINLSLWIFGLLQAISTAGFSFLAYTGYNLSILSCVITFENLSSGMGTAAFLAFMASITNKKFTATQYALLTSFMSIPRSFASSATGYLVSYLGWINFFAFCTIIAIPGLLLLFKVAPIKKIKPL